MYVPSGSCPPIKTVHNVICGISSVTCSFNGESLLGADFFVGVGVMSSVSAPLLAPAAADGPGGDDASLPMDDAFAPAAAGVVGDAALGSDVALRGEFEAGGAVGPRTWGAPAGGRLGGGAPAPGGAISAAAVSTMAAASSSAAVWPPSTKYLWVVRVLARCWL